MSGERNGLWEFFFLILVAFNMSRCRVGSILDDIKV